MNNDNNNKTKMKFSTKSFELSIKHKPFFYNFIQSPSKALIREFKRKENSYNYSDLTKLQIN